MDTFNYFTDYQPPFFFSVQTWALPRAVSWKKCLSPPVHLYNIFFDNWLAYHIRWRNKDGFRYSRIIFTPDVDLKDELKNTAVQITCYDRNGNEVKRVTSTDDGNVEDPENTNGGGDGENTNGTNNTNGGGGGTGTITPGGGDNGGDNGGGDDGDNGGGGGDNHGGADAN